MKPLAGTTVIDFTRVLAGPTCTRILVELGASVIKVEPPSGDAMRHLAKIGDEGRAYLVINPGKRAIAIDLEGE